MEVQLSVEQEAQLSRMAAQAGDFVPASEVWANVERELEA
jgi:hypothetical protein